MNSYMYCNICLFCDIHITLAKLIRILTSLSSYVHLRYFSMWKPFSHWLHRSSLSPVWILQCHEVSSQISFYILFCCENFLLLAELVLFRLTICTHMGNKIAFQYGWIDESLLFICTMIYYLVTANCVTTGNSINFHCFPDFNSRDCICIWSNYS